MSKEKAAISSHAKTTFFFAAQPTVPIATKIAFSNKLFDPSAALPSGRSYPVPSFFDYRIKPKEYDAL